jgi:hypothetical protein
VAPAVIQFNGQIAEESVVYGQSVFLIELEYASGDPVQGLSNQEPPTVSGLATARADVETLDGTSAIRILPLEPLNPRKRYIAVVTKGVTDINGDAIVASPSYQNLTDPDLPLGNSALAPVRALINGLWEATAEGFFEVAEAPLTADDIAISYSFTTSNDEKVLQYIAEPGAWFADQLSTFVKVTTAKQTVAAAKFAADLDDESLTVEDGFDFNDDGEITAADFDVNRDGSFTPADFDWNDDGEFGFADVSASTSAILGGFPTPEVKAALDSDNNCDFQGQDFIDCVAPGIANAFAAALPTPTPDNRSGADFNLGTEQPVGLVSAVAGSVQDNFKANFAGGDVLALQGTVSLPYYLGTSGADILADSWVADNALAAGLNSQFAGLGLEIPQADPTTTTTVNYIFPFPKKTDDVDVPVLFLYPAAGTSEGVVIYQHGITTDRSAALTFGTALASLGYTVVAIDQPLHGVAAFTEEEQTTLATRLVTAAVPDGTPQENIDQLVQLVLAGDVATLTSQIGAAAANSLVNTVANAGSTIPGLAPVEGNERHFGLYSPSPGELAAIDYAAGEGDSGSMYINLLNFTNTRDNNRQSAVDQMNLRVSLNSLDLQPFGGADLEGQQFNFVGHSLGTITGAPFIASVNANQLDAILVGDPSSPTPVLADYNDITAVNMLTPGGGIVRLLENSPTFAPRILLGLAGNGLSQGDANLEAFLNVFQAAVDTADPINFTDNLKASTPAYLLSEVEGDTVIPNAADEALWGIGPLSATIPASDDVPVAVTVDSFPAPLAGSRPLSLMFDDGVDSAQFEIYAQADYPVAEGEEPLNHGTPVSAAPAAAFVKMVMEADALFTPELP